MSQYSRSKLFNIWEKGFKIQFGGGNTVSLASLTFNTVFLLKGKCLFSTIQA